MSQNKHAQRRIYAVMLLQIIIAGGTHVVAKSVVSIVPAGPLTFLRTLVSAACVGIIWFLRGEEAVLSKRDILLFLLLGFVGVALNQFLYLFGLQQTTAPNAALLYATTPSMVLVLSRYFLDEQITFRKGLGVLLSFVGVLIVIFERGIELSGSYLSGNIIIFIAVIAWAVFTIMGKTMIIKYGTFRATSLVLISGALVFMPVGVATSLDFSFSNLGFAAWAGIFYLGIGTSVLGYLLWYYALGRIEATKVAVFANGQPIMATLLAWIFLGTTVSVMFVVGGVVTILGVLLTQVADRRIRTVIGAGRSSHS